MAAAIALVDREAAAKEPDATSQPPTPRPAHSRTARPRMARRGARADGEVATTAHGATCVSGGIETGDGGRGYVYGKRWGRVALVEHYTICMRDLAPTREVASGFRPARDAGVAPRLEAAGAP